MAQRGTVLLNNFNSGEVSPLIESRSDLAKYPAACKTVENAFPLTEGGAMKMPGTYYAGLAANGGPLGTATSGKSRLVPFQFSTDQTAVLEFFALGVRIWMNGGLVLSGGVPLVVVTPYAEADLFALDVSTQSADVVYITHASYPPASLNRISDTNWTYTVLALYGTTDVVKTGYSGLGVAISNISVASPCVVTVNNSTQPFNDGDRIYINEVAGMVEINQGQYLVENIAALGTQWRFTLQDPVTSAAIDSSGWLAYAGGGFAVATPALFAVAGDYPACETLHEERLCLAGSTNNPTRINGSTQDDFPEFICDPNDDSYAIQFTLVSQQVDQIRWMISSPNALLLGTAGGVWAMSPADLSSLSQTNVMAKKQTTIGVGRVAPQLVNDAVIWVSRSARVVRLLLYSFITNQWDSPDLTRLNRQITTGASEAQSGIVQTAFQSDPYPIFWAVRADGQLLGMTFERQDQVFAWFRIVTDGAIESVACVSRDNDEDQVWIAVKRTIGGVAQRYIEYFMPQELFGQLSNAFYVHCGLQWNGGASAAITHVSQTNPCVVTAPGHGFINGASVRITGVLGMTQINQGPASAYTITYIDANTFSLDGITSLIWSAYTSGGTATPVTNTVTGMTYLQGKTAVAVGDGAIIWRGTVPASGIVTFPSYANLVNIGLPFTTIIEPMNPILGNREQTSKGKRQKISRATFSLYQSIGGKYGNDQAHLHALAYGPGAKGLQPQLFTGNITRDFDGDWEDEATISIVHDEPFPFCLRCIIPRIDVAEVG